ncbi:GNAT family N-acetyltransferase [Roseobacter sp.]|uniref:GNAT family N-acetyltransferase n=1 Tax=Roseobacter sp. TaxID=1907202 RepID=UPI003296AA5A
MIRWAGPQDADTLGRVFYAAIHEGPSPYTDAQRAAWVAAPPSGDLWRDRLAGHHIAMAERDGNAAGFMSIMAGGYIDLAFMRLQYRGQGIFRQLYEHIDRQARSQGDQVLSTHASLMAQPAFRAMGFLVIHHETVERHGETLARAKMEKRLG